MQTEIVKIGIVDAHPIFRQGLSTLLVQLGHQVVLEAGNGIALQAALRNVPLPGLLLLDLRMPVMNGFETLKWLKTTYPQPPVIILSDCQTHHTLANLISLGAAAVLHKQINEKSLQKAISRVMEDGFYFPDALSRNLWQGVYRGQNGGMPRKHQLSDRQWRLMQLAGGPLSYKGIASEMGMSVHCVKQELHKLYQELDVCHRAELALLAERHGIADMQAESH